METMATTSESADESTASHSFIHSFIHSLILRSLGQPFDLLLQYNDDDRLLLPFTWEPQPTVESDL